MSLESILKKTLIYSTLALSLAMATNIAYNKISYNLMVNKGTKEILKKADDSKIILFGEVHPSSFKERENKEYFKDDNYVIGLLPKLKEKGYGVLCVEIDKKYQNIIDSYLVGILNKEDIDGMILNESTPISTQEVLLTLKYELDFIEKAHNIGYKVLAIDKTDKMQERPNIKEKFLKVYKEREIELVLNTIDAQLANPDKKLIVYIGALHVVKSFGTKSPELGYSLGYYLSQGYDSGKTLLSVDLTNNKLNPDEHVDIKIPITNIVRP